MTAPVRVIRSAAEQALLDSFAGLRDRLPGPAAPRAAAIDVLERQGLPHRRVEAWKYTDLRGAMREAKPVAGAPGEAEYALAGLMTEAFPGLDADALVFVNGAHAPELSSPVHGAGVTVLSLGEALRTSHPLAARLGALTPAEPDAALSLNAAFMADGAIVHVAAGAAPERPILLDFRFAGTAALAVYPRVLLILEAGAKVALVETHRGPDGVAYQQMGVTEIHLGEDAHATHVKLQAQGDQALHLGHALVSVGAKATYETFTLEEGGAFGRREVHVVFKGEGAAIRLNGATLATGRQHLDSTLVVDHVAAHCTSQEIFKYVLAGEARGVFQGKIIVRPHAQKTDGRMSARALLLEEGPEFDAKPELEIYADDVQCAHGAVAGELDADLMFYLRARGIPEGEAKALLVRAFVGEAIEAVEDEVIRAAVAERIERWLEANLH